MIDREEMFALRDAYEDIRDTVTPFVSPSWINLLEGLAAEDAQAEYRPLYTELLEDGYTHREINYLTMIAICDTQQEMQEDIEDYEAES